MFSLKLNTSTMNKKSNHPQCVLLLLLVVLLLRKEKRELFRILEWNKRTSTKSIHTHSKKVAQIETQILLKKLWMCPTINNNKNSINLGAKWKWKEKKRWTKAGAATTATTIKNTPKRMAWQLFGKNTQPQHSNYMMNNSLNMYNVCNIFIYL